MFGDNENVMQISESDMKVQRVTPDHKEKEDRKHNSEIKENKEQTNENKE